MKQKYIDCNKDEKLRLVSKDIIEMKILPSDTMDGLLNKFYKIMVKHGIKKTHSKDGGKTFTGNTFEYTICKTLFQSQVSGIFNFADWGVNGFKDTPKNIER